MANVALDPRTQLQNYSRAQFGCALRSRGATLGAYEARGDYSGSIGVYVVCGAAVYELCAASEARGEEEEAECAAAASAESDGGVGERACESDGEGCVGGRAVGHGGGVAWISSEIQVVIIGHFLIARIVLCLESPTGLTNQKRKPIAYASSPPTPTS